MAKKVGVVRFLGTNCDRDIWQAVEMAGSTPQWLWYQDQFDPKSVDAIIIPGGFSYGDYLRCGALAGRAPVMEDVKKAAKEGMPVLGICNGFQILCETQLLPGALVDNTSLRFIDKWCGLNLENEGQGSWKVSHSELDLPVAHGEGRFVVDNDELKSIQDNQQIWWTYKDNPNGSVADIAGVFNKQKNVAGLMPHPERAVQEWMGSSVGLSFFEFLQ